MRPTITFSTSLLPLFLFAVLTISGCKQSETSQLKNSPENPSTGYGQAVKGAKDLADEAEERALEMDSEIIALDKDDK